MPSSTAPTPSPSVAGPPESPGPAELYERLLVGPLFRPWAERLVDRVPLARRARVLDVACGTGIVARLAAERVDGPGRVVAVDRSPGMLAVARTIAPAIDWREGAADALPIGDDERFDAVFCQQGLQFFPDRPAAVRAMAGALAPGGWLAIGVWRSLEENGLFCDLGRVAERFVGPIDDARHAFADADALARLLTEAGLGDVAVAPTTLDVRFELEPSALARLNATAVIGMSATARAMSEHERAELLSAIVAASLTAVEPYHRGGATTFPTSANVATGRA